MPQRFSIQSILLVVLVVFVAGAGSATAEAPRLGSEADPVVAKAISWIRTQQLPDGGFGFRDPSGTATTDAKTTADVIYALALAGEAPASQAWAVNGKTPLDALALLAPDYAKADPGQAGKVARAVVLAGGNPRNFAGLDLIAIIKAAYDPTTGRYSRDFLFRHTLAVEALLRAGESVPPAALQALKLAQLPSGGWSWGFPYKTADVDTTGRVMLLLGGLAEEACVPGARSAANFLARTQLPGGGWEDIPSTPAKPANANSTALAGAGLLALGYDPAAAPFMRDGKSAWDHLLSFQEDSGAFVYINRPGMEEVRLMATVDALIALTQARSPAQSCRSLYLYLPLVLAR